MRGDLRVLRRLFGRQEEKSADDLRIEESLQKTRSGIFGQIGSLFRENEISDELWEELEEALIVADVGMETTMELVECTRAGVEREGVRRSGDAYLILKQEMVKLLEADEPLLIEEPRILTVVLVVGVNGSGKTTTIAKLARRYKERGRRVVLAAGDTFRAAAIDQLKIWGERAEVEVIAQAPARIRRRCCSTRCVRARRAARPTCSSPIRLAACRTNSILCRNWKRCAGWPPSRSTARRTKFFWYWTLPPARTPFCKPRVSRRQRALPALS